MCKKLEFNCLLQNELDKKWYAEYEKAWLQPNKLRRQAFVLAGKMSKFVSSNIVRDVRYPINHAKSLLFSKMKCTVKSHKPAGDIKVRPLHTSVDHFLFGLSAWIDLVLGSILKCIPYICKCSQDVIHTVNSTVLDVDACLYKLDIKDFFLDGEHRVLVELCTECVKFVYLKGSPFLV